jgi:hypothetical protein
MHRLTAAVDVAIQEHRPKDAELCCFISRIQRQVRVRPLAPHPVPVISTFLDIPQQSMYRGKSATRAESCIIRRVELVYGLGAVSEWGSVSLCDTLLLSDTLIVCLTRMHMMVVLCVTLQLGTWLGCGF